MKKSNLCLPLCALFLGLFPAMSQAADPVKPRTSYLFDFSDFKGVVKEVKITFNNPESKEDMSATTDATLKDGTTTSGEFSCRWTNEKKSIDCERDDAGGSFTFINQENEYKLSFERFDLNEEGEEADVAVISRKPAEADEVIGKKIEK